MPDPSTMTPEQFLREVGEILKMPTDKPETIVSALRDLRTDFDQFAEWAQPYLDSGSWGGHSILDAIKQELIARDESLKRVRALIEDWRLAAENFHLQAVTARDDRDTASRGALSMAYAQHVHELGEALQTPVKQAGEEVTHG